MDKQLPLYILLVSTAYFVIVQSGELCQHNYPKYDEVLFANVVPTHSIKKRSPNENLRILLDYDDSVYRLDSERFAVVNNVVLPRAVQWWQQVLSVRQPSSRIRLSRRCESTQVFIQDGLTHCISRCKEHTYCGEVLVKEQFLDACRWCNRAGKDCQSGEPGEGITDADFVLFVSANQTERCNRSLTVAYAAHCQQEATLDRPVAGHANLCPASISNRTQELDTLLSTVKHEILHALGFSLSLYAFYRDDAGVPLTPRLDTTGKPPFNEHLQTYQWSERTVREVRRDNWLVRGGAVSRNVHLLVTPRVVREVREHFNCSTLEGAELEDQGEEGTALTHWEKRVFENEAMTGTHTQNPVVSRVTLALMEDTGWYYANYSMADEFTWGSNLGCDFVTKSCKEWIDTHAARHGSIHPFCDKVKRDPLQTECTDDRNSVALCNLLNYSEPLPKTYQNFDSIAHVERGQEVYYGGSVSLADYCPYIQEFTWRSKNVVVRGSHCQYAENNPRPDKNFALEQYGPQSRCFEHSERMWEEKSCRLVRQWQHWGSGCYEYTCRDGRLHVHVANYTYACHYPGQHVLVRIVRDGWLHHGAIVCPPCAELCPAPFECRKADEAPPPTHYPYDQLRCLGVRHLLNTIVIFIAIVTISVY